MSTQRMFAGKTKPGGTAWQPYPGGGGIFLDVDTSAGQFAETPMYTATLLGKSSHWAITGITSIYDPTPTGFRVYVRWSDGKPLTTDDAANLGWYVSWLAMEYFPA